MVDKLISLHCGLVKIDFTLVLLTPIITQLQKALEKTFVMFGSDIAASTLFSVIAKRADDIIESISDISTSATNIVSPENDILDLLFSFVPYENIIEALSLTICRDYILSRTNRDRLVKILENKIGSFRLTNINIIKKDFEYFNRLKENKNIVLKDILTSLQADSHTFISDTLVVDSFVYSEHYWSENNLGSLEDIFNERIQVPPYQTDTKDNKLKDKLSLHYTDNHTYVDITVEHNNKSIDITIPMIYLTYKNIPEMIEKYPEIELFWQSIEQKLSPE
ncbi:hypothetical protein NEOKW01_1684 [Nematocida sp. AWRm80]|nr:hypothetical protein NEOKW01_1684 [Nematocida sp. AWRm80]